MGGRIHEEAVCREAAVAYKWKNRTKRETALADNKGMPIPESFCNMSSGNRRAGFADDRCHVKCCEEAKKQKSTAYFRDGLFGRGGADLSRAAKFSVVERKVL